MKKQKSFVVGEVQTLYLIGVGGTGGFLAQGLAKMITGYGLRIDVTLVDPDIVEERNCIRQNFWQYEVGQPKAKALAFRLNQQFGVSFAYEISKFEDLETRNWSRLVVSCIDNIAGRKKLKDCGMWLDLGNDVTNGQAIFGQTANPAEVERAVQSWDASAHALALPNAYLVANMKRLRDKRQQLGCADHPFAEQGAFVNEFSAYAGLAILHQILVLGQVKTPQIYFDMSTGRMLPKPITRELLGGY